MFGRMRSLRLLTIVLVSIVPAAVSLAEDGSERPNIVFILADDVGADVLGSYGGTSFATPHLDRLAATGLRFEHCYSMPACHPTRICLLTGRYPFQLGNPGWGTFPRSLESATLPHVLKRAGYATCVAGKWQLTLLKDDLEHPHRLGFDEYCLFGWHEGARYYAPHIWQNGTLRTDVGGRYGPTVYVEFLVDFMRKNRDRPLFAFYSMALCHDVTNDLDEPVKFGPHGRYDTYGEMVAAMDDHVGRLVSAVDDLGLRRKTLIVFTGDNGTPERYIHSFVDGRFVKKPIVMRRGDQEVRGAKGALTDGGTRVPLIANWAGVIDEGQVVDDLVDFSDFLPTFADVAHANIADGSPVTGYSFADRLRGTGAAPRRWAFAERRQRCFVRTQRWKLYDDGRLLDMADDPAEQHPIAVDGQSQEAAAARRQLTAALTELRGR